MTTTKAVRGGIVAATWGAPVERDTLPQDIRVPGREAIPASPVATARRINGLLGPGPDGDTLRRAVRATRQADGRVNLDQVQKVVDMVPEAPSLTDFVAPAVAWPASSLRLEPIGGAGHSGSSGAEISFVESPQGDKLGVLKIYPDTESFGNELSGMVRLQEPDLAKVHGTSVLRAGKTADGRPMVLMTCAPGHSLNDLLLKGDWATTRKAVAATAATLATLHSAAAGSGTRPPAEFINQYIQELRDKTRQLAAHPEALQSFGLTPERLTHQVESAICGVEDELAQGHVPNGLNHGDTHPGNFCYDPTNGNVTLIDMNRMQRSMDETGGPRGCPAFDVTKLPQRLVSLAREGGMPDARAHELETIFADAYRQAGGPQMPQAVLDFFDLRSAVAGALRKIDKPAGQTRLSLLARTLDQQSESDTGIRNQILKAAADAERGEIPHAIDSEVLSEHYPAIHDLLDRPLTPFDTPVLIAERQRQVTQRYNLLQKHLGQTMEISTAARKALRDRIVADLYGDPSQRACQRQAWVIIGGPGSGKSTLSRDLQTEHHALVIDGDAIREQLPEFQQYELTDQVRDEKRALQARLRTQAADRGENLVMSFSPKDVDQVAKPVQALQDEGYTVHVALVSVSLSTGVARAAHRFEETGRWSDCFDDKILGHRAETVYHQLEEEGIGDSFEAYTNDVAGQKPQRVV